MRAASRPYRLAYWDTLAPDDRRVPPVMATGWLSSWISDPSNRREVVEICDLIGLVTRRSAGWLDERELHRFVRPAIERALLTGELLLVERAKAATLPGISPAPEAEAPSFTSAAEAPAAVKTWIEFQVIDSSDEPMEGVRWEIVLTDGTKKAGKTDASGLVRFDEIDPGVCEVLLLDVDGGAIELLDAAGRAARRPAPKEASKAAPAPPAPAPAAAAETTADGAGDEVFVLAAALQAIGDMPLVNQLVRILDPDTGKQVGEDLTTDDEGVVRAEVPEKKDYRVEIVEEEVEIPEPPPPLPEPMHAVLVCEFVDAAGQPLANEPVALDAEGDDADATVTTDEDGRIEAPAPLGPCRLKVRDQEFLAHSLPIADGAAEENLYRFVVESK